MNGMDFKMPADEAVKIYIPRSFSSSTAKELPENEAIKIYDTKKKNFPSSQ